MSVERNQAAAFSQSYSYDEPISMLTNRPVMRPAHWAVAFAGIIVPILSAAFLIAALSGPLFVSFPTATLVVMPAVFGLNVANLLGFVWASRGHRGPERLRNFLSIGAVFSGICLSVVVVLASMFSMLGG